ncbi:hypothetical protein E2562_014605 [Oryza meyeriana var. granulata]|uniref:Uncharacterized protein n=1 Tax=Oryza meyeriana var. granulata TaxID=110450 RepID=A0A6G1DVJ5_9ORYZ|nr:hypothetical protein E2562_014605 [Oryza meyeriana var. granulata]
MASSANDEAKPKPRLIVRLGIFLASHHILFSALCCTAGIIALLFLPSLAKNTYLSENALIPGSANTLFTTEDVLEANRFAKGIEAATGESRDGTEIPKFIAQQMKNLGAEVYYHEFLPDSKCFHPLKFFTSMTNNMAVKYNGTYTNFGINTIGIIRAPRGDGKEAIVLVTPYNSQRVQPNELLSLALGFSVFSLLSRAAWLSKDIIWLSADSQFGEYAAVSAWLNQYHNPMFLSHPVNLYTKMYGASRILYKPDGTTEKAEVMAFKRAGTMAAALIFKVGETRKYGDRDSVMMYAEASNGQMPNLDLLNVVHYLAVHRQGFRVNIETFSSLLSSSWLRAIAEVFQSVGSVLRKINPDWKFDVTVPDYVEGTANLANSMYNQALGVPTAPSKFISVGVYMIPFALLLAPLPIVAAALADGSETKGTLTKVAQMECHRLIGAAIQVGMCSVH